MDLWRKLIPGVKFDRKRFGKDMDMFTQRRDQAAVPTSVTTSTGADGARSDPLDFFGTQSSYAEPSSSSSSKAKSGYVTPKNKMKRKRSTSLSSSSSSSSFSSSPEDSSSDGKNNKKGNKKKKNKNSKQARKDRKDPNGDMSDDDDGSSGDESSSSDARPLLFTGSTRKRKESKSAVKARKERAKAERILEKIAHHRKRLGIHVEGDSVPPPIMDNDIDDDPGSSTNNNTNVSSIVEGLSRGFGTLRGRFGAREYLLSNIQKSGYSSPTAIQSQAIPVMASGRDLLAGAPTGTGKTASFVIPLLMRLVRPEKGTVRAIVLTPTRELAKQTEREFAKLGDGKKWRITVLTKATASKNSFSRESASAARVDVLITTPFRLVQLIKENAVTLDRVAHLVFDEADRLWEAGGFLEQVDEILAACKNPSIQRCLFSATLPQPIEELARTVLRDPVRVLIGERNSAATTVKQRLVFVGSEDGKLIALRQMIRDGFRPPALVFVQSIDRAKELFHELVYDGVKADVIHGERTRAQRDRIVDDLRAGKVWLLICTELMARGVDFRGLNLVINYDFPQSVVSYVHRIGRTGRMTRTGEAVTFFTESDRVLLRSVANVVRASGSEVPDWMLEVPKGRKSDRRRLEMAPPKRARIETVPKVEKAKAARKRDIINNSKKKKERIAAEKMGEEGEN